MQCPKCQFENREGAKFCNECGSKFDVVCPKCNASNRVGSKFCDECGNKLTAKPAPPPNELSFDEKLTKIQKYLPKGLTEKILSQKDRIEGERKHVTVMFCDLEGFTKLSEKLGPEESYSIMNRIYEILIHKVHDYEGTVTEIGLLSTKVLTPAGEFVTVPNAVLVGHTTVNHSRLAKRRGSAVTTSVTIGPSSLSPGSWATASATSGSNG